MYEEFGQEFVRNIMSVDALFKKMFVVILVSTFISSCGGGDSNDQIPADDPVQDELPTIDPVQGEVPTDDSVQGEVIEPSTGTNDGNGNGVSDAFEASITQGTDIDGDNLDDRFDVNFAGGSDANNNGVSDRFESDISGGVDTNNDGLDDVAVQIVENIENFRVYNTIDGFRRGGANGEISTADASTSGAILSATKWEPGEVVSVKFVPEKSGTIFQRDTITNIAKEWEEYANITFEFQPLADTSPADIRIILTGSGASNSFLGNQARSIPQSQHTMEFGWFTDNTPIAEFRRTVFHEFGHALGMIHEHQNPQGNINWNVGAVYAYYREYNIRNNLVGTPAEFTPEKVDRNIFSRYELDSTNSTEFDGNSIMLYPIDAKLTNDGYSTQLNTELSPADKKFISREYPQSNEPVGPSRQDRLFTERFECRKTNSRGCTASRQICYNAIQPGTSISTQTVSIRTENFFGRNPVCRIDINNATGVCITGHIESGGGGGNINQVFTIDCETQFTEIPIIQ